MKRKDYIKAKSHLRVSVGESVRIIRELQQMSQIENDRVAIGIERAKVIAKALKCHRQYWSFPDGN